MSHLDIWKEQSIAAISLEAQAKRAQVEADYALAMHKAESFGSYKGQSPVAGQPAPAAATAGAAQPQGAQVGGNGNGKIVCAECQTEITDSPSTRGDGSVFTAQKKAELSVKKHSAVLCYHCAQKRG